MFLFRKRKFQPYKACILDELVAISPLKDRLSCVKFTEVAIVFSQGQANERNENLVLSTELINVNLALALTKG